MSAQPSITVLHVDDDESTRETLGQVLLAEGFAVATAATGAEALRRAAEQPDVILLDVLLPDVSGFEVCRRLKSDPLTATIPILQLSGCFVRSEDRAHGLEGGADAYLTKPVEPRELVAHIHALVRLHRAVKSFHSLAENVPDVVARFDAELRHVFVNRRVEALTGIPARNVLGKTLRELGMPDRVVALAEESLCKVFATKEASTVEFEFPQATGPRFFETRFVPEFASDGAVATVLVISRDVTIQKQAERALRQSEQHLRAVFEIVPDCINLVACDGADPGYEPGGDSDAGSGFAGGNRGEADRCLHCAGRPRSFSLLS